MVSVVIQQSLKPTELVPQQASFSTVASLGEINIDQVQAICQEFLGKLRENVDATLIAAYEATLAEKQSSTRELSIKQRELRQMEAELDALRQNARQTQQMSEQALADFRVQAEQSVAFLVQTGILTSEEADRRVQSALSELQAKLNQAQRESESQATAIRKQVSALRRVMRQEHSAVTSLDVRLAELREAPSVAQHLAALEEKRRREKEQVDAAIRFLRNAPWRDFSRNRKITAGLAHAQGLSNQNLAVFDALVERLSTELDSIGRIPPAIAWSVIRVIEQLGLQEMFPELPCKRAALAAQARAYKREKRARQREELPDKVVSLASRWGARLVASR